MHERTCKNRYLYKTQSIFNPYFDRIQYMEIATVSVHNKTQNNSRDSRGQCFSSYNKAKHKWFTKNPGTWSSLNISTRAPPAGADAQLL